MAISIVMPALEMAQETGKIISWLKKEGDSITKGEPLAEIETDKVVLELEASERPLSRWRWLIRCAMNLAMRTFVSPISARCPSKQMCQVCWHQSSVAWCKDQTRYHF